MLLYVALVSADVLIQDNFSLTEENASQAQHRGKWMAQEIRVYGGDKKRKKVTKAASTHPLSGFRIDPGIWPTAVRRRTHFLSNALDENSIGGVHWLLKA